MKYLDFIKEYEKLDKYVLFLLSLGFSINETAELTEITRQTIYNILKRNQYLLKDYEEIREKIEVKDV